MQAVLLGGTSLVLQTQLGQVGRVMTVCLFSSGNEVRCTGRGLGLFMEVISFFLFFFFFVFFFAFSRATLVAYGGSQARGPIGAAATGLRQSHSNAGSESRLQPTPQLTATPDH